MAETEECIVFVKEGGQITANLLFEPSRILSVRDSGGNILQEGVDYQINGRMMTSLSTTPFLTAETLKNKEVPSYLKSENERYKITGCLLMDAVQLFSYQLHVHYVYDRIGNAVPDPVSKKIRLPYIRDRILAKKKLRVILYGDSISNAANSSWEMGIGARGPWYECASEEISRAFGVQVDVRNFSKSGYGTVWGVSAAKEKFQGCGGDLFIIAFGMNDGAERLSADDFAENIRRIMNFAKNENPNAEFILISPPLANPLSKEASGFQSRYRCPLKKMQDQGIACIDMTSVYAFLMQRKRYCEISGNNLNHPNDFTYGIYEKALVKVISRAMKN